MNNKHMPNPQQKSHKNMGRKPLPDNEKRSFKVTVALTPIEHAYYELLVNKTQKNPIRKRSNALVSIIRAVHQPHSVDAQLLGQLKIQLPTLIRLATQLQTYGVEELYQDLDRAIKGLVELLIQSLPTKTTSK